MSELSSNLQKLRSEFASDPEMAELVDMFIAEMPARLKSLQDSWNESRFDDLKRLAHQLKGASGGYGFSTIGSAAGALEATLKTTAGKPDHAALATLEHQVEELVTLCRRAAA